MDSDDSPKRRRAREPLVGALHRIDCFFQQNEVDGVVLDSRYVINATEAARLSVVPQLLGYAEVHRVVPTRRIRRDIARRADFLLARFDELRSGSVFDGMLGYAFFEAYEATGDHRYLTKALDVVHALEGLSSQYVLNGGLMAAMAFAKHHQLTGDAGSDQRTRDIVATLPVYQNEDGSFPHWCPSSADVHYTDWMAMELILIQRMVDDPLIAPMLAKIHAFMEQRVGADGNTRYEKPCDDYPGCVKYYYSIASGCDFDYDTRAFTNELGYSALLFDQFRSPKYRAVMAFLRTLEHRGTFPDKWDFWPPVEDPYYVWTAADTSVVNTSLIFWSLASVFSGRYGRSLEHAEWFPEDSESEDPGELHRFPALALRGSSRADAGSGAGVELERVVPNPSHESCTVRFRLPAPAQVAIAIHDASGRTVRKLLNQSQGAGPHEIRWDRRDQRGRSCTSGVYFARIQVGHEMRSVRFVLVP